jgi:hypothetical protein
MPRFYFDTHDGETFMSDEAGLELDGIEAARAHAQAALCDVMSDVIPVTDQRTVFVRVRDMADHIVLKAGLSLVLEVDDKEEGASL